MKNIRRIIAVLIAAVLLPGVIPAAVGESDSDFAGTQWYATGISFDRVDWNSLSLSDLKAMGALSCLTKFVPYESWLSTYNVFACCWRLDFYTNGTFRMTLKLSMLGGVDTQSYEPVNGNWFCRDHTVYLYGNGGSALLLPFRNGVLSMDMNGAVVHFERV